MLRITTQGYSINTREFARKNKCVKSENVIPVATQSNEKKIRFEEWYEKYTDIIEEILSETLEMIADVFSYNDVLKTTNTSTFRDKFTRMLYATSHNSRFS